MNFVFLEKDVTNNTCFGSDLNRFMLDQFIGYQEILMSSVKQLAEKETHKGNEIIIISANPDHFFKVTFEM